MLIEQRYIDVHVAADQEHIYIYVYIYFDELHTLTTASTLQNIPHEL